MGAQSSTDARPRLRTRTAASTMYVRSGGNLSSVRYTAAPPSLVEVLDPRPLLRTAWGRRSLLAQLTRREIEGRYRGSLLGVAWSFATPVAFLAIYTFVFGAVFRARWPQAPRASLAEFAVVLFAGLVVFNFFSECASRAPGLIASAPNYVKKVVFPLELLALSVAASAAAHALVSLVVLVASTALLGRIP